MTYLLYGQKVLLDSANELGILDLFYIPSV